MDKNLNITNDEEYYKNIIEHMPGIMIVFSVINGMLCVRYISSKCIEISGFTADEVYNRLVTSPIVDVHPDDKKIFEQNTWDKAEDKISFTYRIICKNGQCKWVQLDLSRVAENDEVLYYGFISDIDKQYKILELQKEKDDANYQTNKEIQNMYDNILNETHSMITVIDAESYKVVYANKTAIEKADIKENYIGCTCYKGFHNKEKPCEECLLLKKDVESVQVKEVTYLGRTYRMLKKIFTWNGRKALLEFSDDITEQYRVKEVEKELSRDKEKEKIVLDSIPGGVALYHITNDGSIHVSYVSEGLAGILGYTTKEFIEIYGDSIMESIVEEDRVTLSDAIKNLIDNHTPISIYYRCYTKSGNIIAISFEGNAIDIGEKLQGEIISLYAVQTLISDKHQKDIKEEEIRKKMMDYISTGMGIYDLYNGTASLLYLNNAYMKMMGLRKEDREKYYGHDVLELIYPDDHVILKNMIDEIYQGKQLTNVVFRIKDGSKKWKWINLVMNIIKEKNGHYTGYASLYDFDKIIQTQQEMEAAHKKEETLLSSIPGGIAIYRVKTNGKVVTEYVSEPLAKMCGYSTEEFLTYLKDDSLINIVPEDIPMLNATISKSLEENSAISVMYHIYKKDRTTILIRLDANMIQTELLADDEIAVFYAVHTLVSDESKKIMEEQKNFSLLLNSVPAGIGAFLVEDNVLNLEYLNDAFFKIINTSREELSAYAGKKSISAIYKDDLPRVQESIATLVNGAHSTQVDYRVINKSGKYIWFHVTASVVERKESYIRFFAAFFNCTDSKEQELILLQNERAVELAQIQGDLAIWTYNIDKGIIIQQTSIGRGAMGYKFKIERVPEIFIESGSVYPDDIDKYLKAYKDLADGKEKVDVTYRFCNEDTGKYSWLRMFYQRMENTDENDRMAVGFSMNVDKQQEAIERYKAEQLLRKHMNDNVELYIEYNLTKDCYEAKEKMIYIYHKNDWEGVSISDYMAAMSQSIEEVYAKEVAEKMYSKNLLKAFESGETRVYVEYRSKERENMPSVWHRTSASLAKRPDTGDVMAFIYVENIEKEKESKIAIESSLSDGIESIAIIRVEDGQTRLIKDDYSTNEKVLTEEYFTYDDDFVWRSHNAVVEEDNEFAYRAALLSNIIKELEYQEVFQYSIGTHNRKGVFKRQLFRFRYLDDRKKSIILSVSDITPIYMEEQAKKKQIEQALAELKKASAAKADFYSRMSHDMRTPMNGILGMTALSENEEDANVLRKNIEKIHESGEYLLNLINDTLDIQRIESGKLKLEPQVVHTKKTLSNILEMVQPIAKAKGINLQFDEGNTDINLYVRTDQIRIKQIFVNLLSNAIKFTPSGGKVEFKAQFLGRDGMIAHDVFTISDTGIGMSEEFLKDGIFQPFSQENNQITANYAGSGLGLSIVKSLVELMNGRIDVVSELGVGTTFTIYLDFECVEKIEAEQIISSKKTMSENVTDVLKGKNILLVEDHPLNAEIAKKLLEKVGCVVSWAQNGKIGTEIFAASKNEYFDAVLMDIRMPIMDGLEAAKHIRSLEKKDAKTVPIIAMTANAYEDDIKKSAKAGMNAHLGKPIEPQKLYFTLAERMEKKYET